MRTPHRPTIDRPIGGGASWVLGPVDMRTPHTQLVNFLDNHSTNIEPRFNGRNHDVKVSNKKGRPTRTMLLCICCILILFISLNIPARALYVDLHNRHIYFI